MQSPSPPKTSLSSSSSPASPPWKPARLDDYLSLSHAPNAKATSSIVKPLSIKVESGPNGTVPAFLHLPPSTSSTPATPTCVIFLSGAGGGVAGPSAMYLSLAEKLASLPRPMAALRLDYRFPARTAHCVRDVQAAMRELQDTYHMSSFVLVGWSFGGAPVFTVASRDSRVLGCVGIASQTADTEGIALLAPRPVLLIHGTGDRTLGYGCSERLYEAYGTGGKRVLRLFEGDDHALTRSSQEAEQVVGGFVLECAGVGVRGNGRGMGEVLVGEEEKMELMWKGGDLRGKERVE